MNAVAIVIVYLVLLVRRDLELVPAGARPHLLECVELLGDLLHPAAVDQLVDVEAGAAVGTLRPLLRQPPPDAHVATQLRAANIFV